MVTPDGIVSTVVPGGVVTQPHDLDITHKGELVVTDAYQGVLHVFDLNLQRPDHIKVPRSSYTARMVDLLDTGEASDITFQVRAIVAGTLSAGTRWQRPEWVSFNNILWLQPIYHETSGADSPDQLTSGYLVTSI